MTAAIPKPPYGAPCNGCGLCCREVTCPLGAAVTGATEGPCPALLAEPGGKSACGLVSAPERWSPFLVVLNGRERMSAAAAVLVGAGIGCDAQEVDEPRDHAADKRLRAVARAVPMRMINDACKLWRIGALMKGI